MKVSIVYHSTTGTTAEAAEAMGKVFQEQGHECQVMSVLKANPEEVSEADLICIGTWVRGFFIIKQHPTYESMYFIDQLENLTARRVLVFCTFKLAIGSTLHQMTEVLEAKGAEIVGEFKYRGATPSNEFLAFATSLI